MVKNKCDKQLLTLLIILSIISIITIFSAQNILPEYMQKIYIKQTLWYILGFITITCIIKININWIYEHIWIIYTIFYYYYYYSLENLSMELNVGFKFMA